MKLDQMLSPAFLRATRVLEIVEVPGPTLGCITVHPYSNGREQGYTLNVYGIRNSAAFTFSEHRSSDAMVLYEGFANAFDRTVTDHALKNQKLFAGDPYKTTDTATDFGVVKLALYLQKQIEKVLHGR
jgi:hypothetical protein